MPVRTALTPRVYFSYGQFLVYDRGVKAPGCLWSDAHIAQGFSRRESTVCFSTLLEFGFADVTHVGGLFEPNDEYERVIAVPFRVFTGTVVVDGPDEINVERTVELPTGNYRLIAAQREVGDEDEVIDLYFEPRVDALEQSEILVADRLLRLPIQLIETSEVA